LWQCTHTFGTACQAKNLENGQVTSSKKDRMHFIYNYLLALWFIDIRRSKNRNAYVIELFAKRKKGLHIQSLRKFYLLTVIY